MYSASASEGGATARSQLARAFIALMSLVCATCFGAIPPAPALKDLPLWAQQQQAPVKRALVIGIADYTHIPGLQTPTHDADIVAKELSELPSKFIVTRVDVNATGRLALINAFRAFAKTVQPGDVVLVYYSGHGVEQYGVNYLVPSDATLPDPGREGFVFISLQFLLDTLSDAKPAISLVVLDACRANPFSDPTTQNDILDRPDANADGSAASPAEVATAAPASAISAATSTPDASTPAAAATPVAEAASSPLSAASSPGDGAPALATPPAPTRPGLQPIATSPGFIVAYAAAPGHAAYSLFKGESPTVGSIFTRRLVADIDSLDQPINMVLSAAGTDVLTITNHQQSPYVNTFIAGELLLQPNENMARNEEETWSRIVANSPSNGLLPGLSQFLAMFPAGPFSAAARQHVADLQKPKTPFLAVADLGPVAAPQPISGALTTPSISAPRQSSQLVASVAYVMHDLKVRASPHADKPPVVTTLRSGDQVAVLDSESRPGWVKVLTANGSVGYVGSVVTDSLRSKTPPLELTLEGDDFDTLIPTLKSTAWQAAVASPSSVVTVSTALSSEKDQSEARRTALLRSLRLRAVLIEQGVPTAQIQIAFDAAGETDSSVIKVIPGASK